MATDARWTRIVEIFGDAIERPAAEWAAFVEGACAGDSELRCEVERLLRLHASSGGFLEPPPQDTPDDANLGRLAVGDRVGDYVLTRHIATGGMGIVFEARQESPERRVALKMVHPSLVSPETLRRLSVESEALARLRHPGIAQIFATGAHDFGYGAQPFIAMELVEGVPLLSHVATLGVEARVAILAEIAFAVQHAHEKGVLHRDLKPSNILVEAEGRPRILDFGIARVLGAGGAETVTRTATGSIVGTVRYMSPERLAGDTGDADTRSDIYSLGVVAYEVLSGHSPFQPPSQSLVDLVQAVRRQDVVPLGRVAPSLGGDLASIVMKAMAPERSRRYATAQDLGEDLRRFLAHEPVAARPPTALYQLRLFARRHRAVVFGVAATVLALVGGLVLYAMEARRASAAAREATVAASTASAVSEFLVRMLSKVDPNRRSDTVDLRALVDGAAAEIGELFADKPLEQAAVRNEVGTIYYSLGRLSDAEREYRIARDLRAEHLGREHSDTLDATNNLGQAILRKDRLDEALALLREAYEGRMRLLGERHPKTLASTNNLAMALEASGDLVAAEALLRRVVDGARGPTSPPPESTLIAAGNLANLLQRDGRHDEALAQRRIALEGSMSRYGPDHRLTALAQSGLGRTLQLMKRYDEAEAAYRAALESLLASRGGMDADTCVVEFRYAEMLDELARHAEAADRFRRARAIEIELHGAATRNALRMGVREAQSKADAGQAAEALALFETLVNDGRSNVPGDDQYLLDAQLGLARSLALASRHDEALRTVDAAMEAANRGKPEARRMDALRRARDDLSGRRSPEGPRE
jgi:serine/threonine protein kinase